MTSQPQYYKRARFQGNDDESIYSIGTTDKQASAAANPRKDPAAADHQSAANKRQAMSSAANALDKCMSEPKPKYPR